MTSYATLRGYSLLMDCNSYISVYCLLIVQVYIVYLFRLTNNFLPIQKYLHHPYIFFPRWLVDFQCPEFLPINKINSVSLITFHVELKLKYYFLLIITTKANQNKHLMNNV